MDKNFDDFLNKFKKEEVIEYPNYLDSIDPLVSVIVPTFQHVDFISECLNSIISQKTDFSYEIILGDDESTDGTREICIKFAEKYKNKVRLFFHSSANNIKVNGKRTGRFNLIFGLYKAKGKYIAICEGDDFWTDADKLQNQVDFLEENTEYGVCFHKAEERNTLNGSVSKFIPDIKTDTIYTITDYIFENKTATCSMMFRREKLFPLFESFYYVPFGDLSIILTVMLKSNQQTFVMEKCMSVYRIHSGGMHGALQKDSKSLIKAYLLHLNFFELYSKTILSENRFRRTIAQKIRLTYKTIKHLHYLNRNYLLYSVYYLKELMIRIRIKYLIK